MTTLEELHARGVLGDIDFELADTLTRISGEASEEVRLGVAFASWAVQNGHVCAELDRLAVRAFQDDSGDLIEDVALPPRADWALKLRSSTLVDVVDAESDEAAGGRPLVFAGGNRIYLRRYYEYEERLARAVLKRATEREGRGADRELGHALGRLFGERKIETDQQRIAALLAVLRNFTVISGGPGTGKTYTVAKALLLMQAQAAALGRTPHRILLLAPTGKAAQRLGEAIRKNLDALGPDGALEEQIPKTASTIHRALGYQPRTPTRFRHDAENPLPYDVVVVDEASMVDLALMTKLIDAVPGEGQLVLLGDKDQLASVEAGAILGDIYGGRKRSGYSKAFAARLSVISGLEVTPAAATTATPGLSDCMVHLTHSHRFQGGGGIAALARAVKEGDAEAALEALDESEDLFIHPVDNPKELAPPLAELVVAKLGGLGAARASEKLALLDGFRILSVHRKGPLGVHAVNERVALCLDARGALEARGDWYDGRPIIVTSNDYQVELFNGDVGVLAREEPDPNAEKLPRSRRLDDSEDPDEAPVVAYFPSSEQGDLRVLAPGRLPPHETVFAMTVHKAQGSEFDEIALLLPEKPSPILTRELVYTAITRARRRVHIFGSREVLAEAIRTPVQRASGLRQRLSAESEPPSE